MQTYFLQGRTVYKVGEGEPKHRLSSTGEALLALPLELVATFASNKFAEEYVEMITARKKNGS